LITSIGNWREARKIHLHYTPTHVSWLNQVEVWFSILTRAVLRGLSATDPREVCTAIDRFTAARNEHPIPFEWTKEVVTNQQSLQRFCHVSVSAKLRGFMC
jgi:hypothetical protein